MLCVGNQCFQIYRLWFDVGIKRDTTAVDASLTLYVLWFDVGIKRDTTSHSYAVQGTELWFDVGIKRDTTHDADFVDQISCGLM